MRIAVYVNYQHYFFTHEICDVIHDWSLATEAIAFHLPGRKYISISTLLFSSLVCEDYLRVVEDFCCKPRSFVCPLVPFGSIKRRIFLPRLFLSSVYKFVRALPLCPRSGFLSRWPWSRWYLQAADEF